jgi:hypothetical protein
LLRQPVTKETFEPSLDLSSAPLSAWPAGHLCTHFWWQCNAAFDIYNYKLEGNKDCGRLIPLAKNPAIVVEASGPMGAILNSQTEHKEECNLPANHHKAA